MKFLGTLLISLIIAAWIVAIAVLSIQNVFITDSTGATQLIALKFLNFSSVEMPVGVAMALCLAAGVLGAALLIPLWNAMGPAAGRPAAYDEDDDF